MGKLKTALDLLPEKIEGLINDYAEKIEKAWMKRDDTKSFTVNFAVKFYLDQGKNCCDVSIAFTSEKIKDHTSFTFDDKQQKLLFEEKKEAEVPEAQESPLTPLGEENFPEDTSPFYTGQGNPKSYREKPK